MCERGVGRFSIFKSSRVGGFFLCVIFCDRGFGRVLREGTCLCVFERGVGSFKRIKRFFCVRV